MEFVLDEATKAGDGATEAWAKDPAGPIQPRVAALVGKLGENMGVARIVRFADGGFVSSYIHMGGKIGVLVEATGVTAAQAQTDAFKTLMKEVAMQVAAASPQFATRAEVPAETPGAREGDLPRPDGGLGQARQRDREDHRGQARQLLR